jgi:hypothetical protein
MRSTAMTLTQALTAILATASFGFVAAVILGVL